MSLFFFFSLKDTMNCILNLFPFSLWLSGSSVKFRASTFGALNINIILSSIYFVPTLLSCMGWDAYRMPTPFPTRIIFGGRCLFRHYWSTWWSLQTWLMSYLGELNEGREGIQGVKPLSWWGRKGFSLLQGGIDEGCSPKQKEGRGVKLAFASWNT